MGMEMSMGKPSNLHVKRIIHDELKHKSPNLIQVMIIKNICFYFWSLDSN